MMFLLVHIQLYLWEHFTVLRSVYFETILVWEFSSGQGAQEEPRISSSVHLWRQHHFFGREDEESLIYLDWETTLVAPCTSPVIWIGKEISQSFALQRLVHCEESYGVARNATDNAPSVDCLNYELWVAVEWVRRPRSPRVNLAWDPVGREGGRDRGARAPGSVRAEGELPPSREKSMLLRGWSAIWSRMRGQCSLGAR